MVPTVGIRPDQVADRFNACCAADDVAVGCLLGEDRADGATDPAVIDARDQTGPRTPAAPESGRSARRFLMITAVRAMPQQGLSPGGSRKRLSVCCTWSRWWAKS